jgi:hypothetical protein
MAGQKRVFARDVPAIHVLPVAEFRKTWMPGIKPGMTSNYLDIPSDEALRFKLKGCAGSSPRDNTR